MPVKKQELGPLQEEWLRCLESGEWKQGHSYLCVAPKTHGRYSYCCLGVACEVAIVNGIDVDVKGEHIVEFGDRSGYLPPEIRKAMRFHESSGTLLGRDLNCHQSLSNANDAGATFKQIAAFVRKHPEAVFTGPA